MKSKNHRRRARHIGARKNKRPGFQTNRDGKFKKKMDGSGEAMTGSLLERLRVPCATADSKEAADEMEWLLAALAEIEEGKGRYSLDRLEHASNAIEDMKEYCPPR